MKKRYKIPNNFKEAGYVFKGMVPLRNAVDAVVLGIVGYFVSTLFAPKDFWDAIGWYIFFVLLFGYIGIIGIQGIPVSTYLFDFIQWLRRRSPYFYNHHGVAYSASAADVMLDSPQLRDHVAAAFDSLKKKLMPAPMAYVEGETFQFAEDPEMAYLQNAEEAEEETTEDAQANASAQPSPATEAPADDKSGLDFDNIIDNITLTDSEVTE